MQITFLGHAGFLVDTDYFQIITDPWLSEKGAFDSSWFQFPCNHHLADFVIKKLLDYKKETFIFISHEHQDHFDIEFLKTIRKLNFTYLIPDFRNNRLYDQLKKLSNQKIIICPNNHSVRYDDNNYLKIYTEDNELNRDSAILISSAGKKFLNLNDCKIFDRLEIIKKEEGTVNVFSCQYSGATWHPVCYEYETEKYLDITQRKKLSKFKAVKKALELLQPELYLPAAGPACFLDPALLHLNSNPAFPRNEQIIDFLTKNTKDIFIPDLTPGDIIQSNGKILDNSSERVTSANFAEYIDNYAARYTDFFYHRKKQSVKQLKEVINDLKTEFRKKLTKFPSAKKLTRALFIGFFDYPDFYLKIDFKENTVSETSAIGAENYYLMCAAIADYQKVTDKVLSWEDFALTFRVKLKRVPDTYEVLMHGFIILEESELTAFCHKIDEIGNRMEKIIVEVEGCKYSLNRYCPHQGADLTHAWIEDNRFLVCPRHRWYFDLHENGNCRNNSDTVNAVTVSGSLASSEEPLKP